MTRFILFLSFAIATLDVHAQTNTWWQHANLPATEEPTFLVGSPPNFVTATDTVNNITYVSEILSLSIGRKLLYTFDGDAWQILGMYDGDINAMCVYHGYLYVGCASSMIYDDYNDPDQQFSSGYLSRFDGESWEYVSPMDDQVNVLKIIDDTLYIGGKFDIAGPLNSPRAVKYDGENWYPIPDNPFGDMPNYSSINAFEKYQGELCMGGLSPDVNDEDLLIYHDGTWQAIGDGIPGLHTEIDFLETYQGELYAAGIIMSEEGNPGNGIQKWNGQTWSQVGGGLNGVQILSIQKFQDGLFVGGIYSHAGDVETSGIARWNGTQWCGLHTSTENQIVPGMFVNGNELYMPLSPNPDDPFFSNNTEVYKWIGGDDFGPCETVTSVENLNLESEICVFPNPSSSGSIRIQSDKIILELRLYDLTGKIVYSNIMNTKAHSIDLSDVQSGIYFLQIRTDNGTVTRKLIRTD